MRPSAQSLPEGDERLTIFDELQLQSSVRPASRGSRTLVMTFVGADPGAARRGRVSTSPRASPPAPRRHHRECPPVPRRRPLPAPPRCDARRRVRRRPGVDAHRPRQPRGRDRDGHRRRGAGRRPAGIGAARPRPERPPRTGGTGRDPRHRRTDDDPRPPRTAPIHPGRGARAADRARRWPGPPRRHRPRHHSCRGPGTAPAPGRGGARPSRRAGRRHPRDGRSRVRVRRGWDDRARKPGRRGHVPGGRGAFLRGACSEPDDPDRLAPSSATWRPGRAPDERGASVGSSCHLPVGADRAEPPGTIVVCATSRSRVDARPSATRFLGVLSHELRTPSPRSSAGRSSWPGRRPVATRSDREVFRTSTEAERLHRLVEDVIALNRFGEAGGDGDSAGTPSCSSGSLPVCRVRGRPLAGRDVRASISLGVADSRADRHTSSRSSATSLERGEVRRSRTPRS